MKERLKYFYPSPKMTKIVAEIGIMDIESAMLTRKEFLPFCALEDTELFEFSTQHFESDNYRIEKGD